MRITPLAVFCHMLSLKDLQKCVETDVFFLHSAEDVHAACLLYSFAIGQLIKYSDEPKRHLIAFENTKAVCTEISPQVLKWLVQAEKFANNGAWDTSVQNPAL